MILMCRKSSTPYRTGIHGLVKKKKKKSSDFSKCDFMMSEMANVDYNVRPR